MNKPLLILAPMAGVNCASFRALCKKYGADIIYSQMYEIDKIIEQQESLAEYLNVQSGDHPYTIQLIGNLKDKWAEATKLVEPYCETIDLNLGCPEPDMLARRSGSYLLQQPEQIRSIIKQIKNASTKPLSAKIRAGWKSEVNAPQIAKLLEGEGVVAIAVHPRFAKQGYSGKADVSIIKKIKQDSAIPVYGNGDVTMPGHAKSLSEQTKCDGIMIGRAAMKDPSIFAHIKSIFETGKDSYPQVSKYQLMQEFIDLYVTLEKKQSLNQVQEHCCWLASDLKESSIIRQQIRECKTISEIRKLANSRI